MQCLSEHADRLPDDEMDLDVNYRQLIKCVNNTMVSVMTSIDIEASIFACCALGILCGMASREGGGSSN